MFLVFLMYRFTTYRGVDVDFDSRDTKGVLAGGHQRHGYAYVLLDSDESIEKLREHQILLSASTMVTKRVHKVFLNEGDYEFIVKNKLGKVSFIEPCNKVFVGGNDKYIIVNGKFDHFDISQYSDFDIISYDDSKIIIKAEENGNDIYAKFTEAPEVESINSVPEGEFDNLFASGFTQKNDYQVNFDEESKMYSGSRYLEDKGITGKDEVVTLIDEFVDFYHGAFYDPDNSIEFNKSLTNHRKFSYYYCKYKDQSEFEQNFFYDSHGTHTCGIIAGKSYKSDSKLSLFNGVAPDAKIAYAGSLDSIYCLDPNQLASLMKNLSSYISIKTCTLTNEKTSLLT